MGRSMSQRKAQAYRDIERLKANRRKDLIKCAAALAAIIVLVTVKLALETSGILEIGNMAVGAVMMMAGIGLAILGGTSSVDFTRSGNEIRGIQAASRSRTSRITSRRSGDKAGRARRQRTRPQGRRRTGERTTLRRLHGRRHPECSAAW